MIIGRKVVGDTITDGVLKQTMSGHFVGEDEKKIQPAIADLARSGIGSILDFAVEDDGNTAADKKNAVIEENKEIEEMSEIAGRHY
jgi:glycine cleavage system H lipoate-binding protein